MNEENKDLKVTAFDNSADLKRKVTRKEVVDVVQQVIDNVNQIADYLMQDVNTLYAKHVFPFQIQVGVIEDLLVEKGIVTKEELSSKYDEKIKALQEKAKEIKEDRNGIRLATEEEEKHDVNEKVLKVVRFNKEKEDKKDE